MCLEKKKTLSAQFVDILTLEMKESIHVNALVCIYNLSDHLMKLFNDDTINHDLRGNLTKVYQSTAAG